MICCQEWPETGPVCSPFTEILATGYYDGPTEGFVRCSVCGRTYVFRMLVSDDGQDMRIFSLAASPQSFGELLDALGRANASGSSVRVVPPLPAAQEELVVSLLALPPVLVLAAKDLTKAIVAWKAARAEDLDAAGDWHAWLGIVAR